MATIDTIRDNVLFYCREQKLTQRKLAKKLNMQEAALSRALSGNPELKTIERIAEALGVPVKALFHELRTVEGYVSVNGKIQRFFTKEELLTMITKH
jgi:transcriptional regulator with XRE-family HTH domain